MTRRGFGALVTDEQWERFVRQGRRCAFTRREQIVRQGEGADTVHLLLSGQLKVNAVRPDGVVVPLAFRGPGELLGESALFGPHHTRSASVTALSKGATLRFSASQFHGLVRELDLESVVLESILGRQRESDEIRVSHALLPADRRLPAALLYLAQMVGEPDAPSAGTPIDSPRSDRSSPLLRVALSQHEIATFAGLSRGSVAQAFIRLRDLGVIRTGYAFVAIVDIGMLRKCAKEGT